MAVPLLGRAILPNAGVGLTSGVDYFKRGGRDAKGGLNQAAPNIAKVDSTPPAGTGINITPSGSESSFSQPVTTGGTPGANPIGLTADQALALNMGSRAAGLIATATNNPTLGKMATAGYAANAADQAGKGNLAPAGSMLGGYYGGLPGSILGGMTGQALSGGSPLAQLQDPVFMTNAAIGLTPLGTINTGMQLATGLFGDVSTSMGDIAVNGPTGAAALGDQGPIDNAQAGIAINNSGDPLGAFMGARGENVSGNPVAMDAAARAISWGKDVSLQNAGGQIAGISDFTANTGMQQTPNGTVSSLDSIAQQDIANFGVAVDHGGLDIGNVAETGMGTNVGGQTVSNDATIAAQDAAVFGDTSTTDTSTSDTGGGVDTDGGVSDGVWRDGGYIDMPGLTQRYQDGGPVAAPQLQAQMGSMMGAQPDAQQMQAQIAQMMRDPNQIRALMARPIQLMQSGELTPDEVVTMGRVAEAAMFNPSLYPQLRQFVAQQGMPPLPAAYDQSVIMRIVVISRVLQGMLGNGQQATMPGQVPPTDQAQMVNPVGMRNGGAVFGPGTGRSDSIGTVNRSTGAPVSIANGEYVIPEHVVRAKGRDFFDGLLRKYTEVPKG